MQHVLTALRRAEQHIDRAQRAEAIETLKAIDPHGVDADMLKRLERVIRLTADPRETLAYLDRLYDETLDAAVIAGEQHAQHYENRAQEYDAMAAKIDQHSATVASAEGRDATSRDAERQRCLAARMREIAAECRQPTPPQMMAPQMVDRAAQLDREAAEIDDESRFLPTTSAAYKTARANALRCRQLARAYRLEAERPENQID